MIVITDLEIIEGAVSLALNRSLRWFGLMEREFIVKGSRLRIIEL